MRRVRVLTPHRGCADAAHSAPSDQARSSAGGAVEIGLRPEHLTLDPEGNTHRIEMTESLGGVSYAYLKGATGERIVVEERGETRSTEGDTVGLILDSAFARLFDAASEIRIR